MYLLVLEISTVIFQSVFNFQNHMYQYFIHYIAVLSFMMPTKTISLRFIFDYFFPVFSWRRTCCHFSWDIYNRSLAALYVYSCYRHSTFYLKISGMRPHFVSPDVLADLSLLYCFKIVASIFLIMSIWNHLVKQISNH